MPEFHAPAEDRRRPPRRPAERDGEHDRKSSGKAWLIPLGVVAALVALYFVWPDYRGFVDEAYAVMTSGDQQRVQRWVAGYGAWGPVTVLALMLAQTVVPVIPSVLLMVATVVAFGSLWGGVLTFAGLLLAASVAYGFGRALGPGVVERLLGRSTERKVQDFVCDYGVGGIVVARISPVISTDAVSFVAGLVGMGYFRFILATAAGTLPLTVLIAWLGESFDRLESGLIWVSAVTLVGFVAYVVWDRRRRRGAPDDERAESRSRTMRAPRDDRQARP